MTTGEARWHAPQPEGLFTYVEFHIDDIAYNVQDPGGTLDQSTSALADVSP
jgi:hypothetical protein